MQAYNHCKSISVPWCSYMPATLLPNRPVFGKRVEPKTALSTRRPFFSNVRASSGTGGSEEVMVKAEEKDEYVVAGLRRDEMPKHLAVILDGNRRWFKMRGLDLDYEPFLKSNLLVADLCLKWSIGTTTCFIYALENMRRSQETNELIFRQFEKFLAENLENFTRKNMKVSVIGESSMYPQSLKEMINKVEEATTTTNFPKLELNFAMCYGGTRDIIHAVQNISKKVNDGEIDLEDINEGFLEKELYYKKNLRAPQVDLLIRTGGHLRLSNYLMWQVSEAELYFTNSDTMAPNFGQHVFIDALRSFQNRERTFGK